MMPRNLLWHQQPSSCWPHNHHAASCWLHQAMQHNQLPLHQAAAAVLLRAAAAARVLSVTFTSKQRQQATRCMNRMSCSQLHCCSSCSTAKLLHSTWPVPVVKTAAAVCCIMRPTVRQCRACLSRWRLRRCSQLASRRSSGSADLQVQASCPCCALSARLDMEGARLCN